MTLNIPNNIVIVWSGNTNNIPEDWFLCDGQNATPDLRNRFVVGAGDTYTVNATGGSPDAILVSHNHNGTTNTIASHTHTMGLSNSVGSNNGILGANSAQTGSSGTSGGGSHSHTLSLSTDGESGIGKNIPPYYALAYIMKGGV